VIYQAKYPERIVCLTEETTETLYLLGEQNLVIGFSDLQADIAKDLIRRGANVLLLNHRSVNEILSMILQLAALTGAREKGEQLVAEYISEIHACAARAEQLPKRPSVYFEEWDEPMISAIRWVSELIGIAGGKDCFPELAACPGGADRIIADPGKMANCTR